MIPALEHTLHFVLAHVKMGSRVLEVGVGDGRLAIELAMRGCRVTALDKTLEKLAPETREMPLLVCVEEDICDHKRGPYDAILFTRSLHHIHELDRALDVAARALAKDGVFVLEDFDVDAIDEATARYFYGEDDPDPLGHWKKEHEGLHSGRAMREGIAKRFDLIAEESAPYLYRALSHRPGVTDARAVFENEKEALAAARIRPVGLRLVAKRHSD